MTNVIEIVPRMAPPNLETEKMKAIRVHEFGGPEVLKYEDAPDPVRGPEQVLVRVKACALNRLDIWQRIGPPRVKVNLPHISGSDISGVVAKKLLA